MDKTNNPDSPVSILFVEDDEIIQELQTSILMTKFPDAVIHTAVNGKLGLDIFNTYHPEIVITDINMSEMSGLQMSVNIRALKPQTKLIAVTGKTEQLFNPNSPGKEFTFDYLIIKPVDLAELFAVVEQCMDEIRQQRQIKNKSQ